MLNIRNVYERQTPS